MTDRDDESAQAYEDPANREPVGPGVRRQATRRLTHHMPVRFPDETISAIRALADEDGLTVSGWVRKVVAEEVDRRTRASSSTGSSQEVMDLLAAFQIAVIAQGENITQAKEGLDDQSSDRNLTQLAG